MNGDIKIGKLLCDEDIITKRQLNKALQRQVKGDKRTLGEILVDLGFCDFDDITNALLNNDLWKNIGILITDHNVHETLSITDRSYLLFEGKILKNEKTSYHLC